MSSIWFESWLGGINPVKVERVTEKCVWVNGHRRLRKGWREMYPTWDEAKAALVEDAEKHVEGCKLSLARAISKLDTARKLEPK